MLFTMILAATTTPWKRTEKFDQNGNGDDQKVVPDGLLIILILVLVVELALAVLAVYLSWTSNSLIGWNAFAKVFFAIVAFLFSVNYLLIHLFNKWDLTSHIRKQNSLVASLERTLDLSSSPVMLAVGGGGGRKSRKVI